MIKVPTFMKEEHIRNQLALSAQQIEKVKELILGREPMLAVDCGANMGSIASELCKIFNMVYAFEPLPEFYELLVENAPTAFHHNFALSDVDGEIEMVKNCAGYGEKADGQRETFFMPCRRLDSFKLPWCDFLKINSGGFDYQVLLGAIRTITRYHPIISIKSKHHIKDIERLMYEHSYKKVGSLQALNYWVFNNDW